MKKLTEEESIINEKSKINNQVKGYIDKLDSRTEKVKKTVKEMSQDVAGLEIIPMGCYVLVQPFSENPFQKLETKSGIILANESTVMHKSEETGEMEFDTPFVQVGTIIETGPDCRFLEAGDVIFYTTASSIVVPFYRQGFQTVSEQRVIAVVNEKLTERKKKMKK